MRSKYFDTLVGATMLAVILIVWTRATHAALEVVEKSYEIDVTQVERWPLSDTDRIVLRPCDDCDRVTLTVTPGTQYSATGSSMGLTREELVKIKSMLRNPSRAYLYIFYRPDDSVAIRIELDADE